MPLAAMKFAALSCLTLLLAVEGIRYNQSICHTDDAKYRTTLQTKLAVFGIECEEMCKKMGIYPNCQCGGFGGTTAFSGDLRMCIDKYCQDPNVPCPTDNFVMCKRKHKSLVAFAMGCFITRF